MKKRKKSDEIEGGGRQRIIWPEKPGAATWNPERRETGHGIPPPPAFLAENRYCLFFIFIHPPYKNAPLPFFILKLISHISKFVSIFSSFQVMSTTLGQVIKCKGIFIPSLLLPFLFSHQLHSHGGFMFFLSFFLSSLFLGILFLPTFTHFKVTIWVFKFKPNLTMNPSVNSKNVRSLSIGASGFGFWELNVWEQCYSCSYLLRKHNLMIWQLRLSFDI